MECQAHELLGFKFIDTPGLCDTSGSEMDDKHLENILAFASEDAGDISAVVWAINGRETRADMGMENTLLRLKGYIPEPILNQSFVVFTMCASEERCLFPQQAFEGQFTPKGKYYVENSAFSTNASSELSKELRQEWKASNTELQKLLREISTQKKISQDVWRSLREKLNKVKSEIARLMVHIDNVSKLRSLISQLILTVEDAKERQSAYSEWKKNEETEVITRVETSYHNTLCTKCVGIHVCHENCALEHAPHGHRTLFQGCACMGPDQWCRKCGHGPEDHFHEFATYRIEKKTVETILEDIKAECETAGADLTTAQESSDRYQNDLNSLANRVDNSFTKIKEHFKVISEICPGFNFIPEFTAMLNTLNYKIKYLPKTCEEYKRMAEKIKGLEETIQSLLKP